jgi:hypothetical protein
MKFTNKIIKRMIAIQEFVESANTLSRIYIKYEKEEITKENVSDRGNIYKEYCSSLYNLISAIKGSKEFFADDKNNYLKFEKKINEKYITDDHNFYNKIGYEVTLYKILEEIRHKNNHYQKDDNDEIILFDAYVDFDKLEDLRRIVNELFYKTYNQIDKKEIKKIILSMPKIKYSLNKLNKKVEETDAKILEINKNVNSIVAEENIKTILLFKRLFNPELLYDLLSDEKSAIEEFNSIDTEFLHNIANYENEINKSGSRAEKESFESLKKFLKENENVNLGVYKNNVNKFVEDLKNKAKIDSK